MSAPIRAIQERRNLAAARHEWHEAIRVARQAMHRAKCAERHYSDLHAAQRLTQNAKAPGR